MIKKLKMQTLIDIYFHQCRDTEGHAFFMQVNVFNGILIFALFFKNNINEAVLKIHLWPRQTLIIAYFGLFILVPV